MSFNDIITQIENDSFEALVSKGIHAILFAMKRTGGTITTDKSKNLLYGYPVGGFNTGGETVDMEEFQDQIRGGIYKTSLPGAIDPGDLTFTTYFAPSLGKPDVAGVVNSMVITPQFILCLARKISDSTLQGFFLSGVNYAGGNDIKGDYGKAIGSSLKFKISGEPKVGYDQVGNIPMSLYIAGADSNIEITSADPVESFLNSVQVDDVDNAMTA